MKTTHYRISVLTSAVAIALLFAVANATAITKTTSAKTNATPASTVAPGIKALPPKTTLTPAVTSSSPVSPAGEDIRDIRQPRHVPTPWFWVVIAAGVMSLASAAFVISRWVRNAPIIEQSPQDLALERLEEARRLMDPEHAREYCFAVSQIIRGFVEDQLCLRAPRLTTEEFLRELVEGQDRIIEAQRGLLGDFLQHCDLAKFAGWRYSLEDLGAMHASAINFVQQTSTASTTATATHAPVKTAPTNAPVQADSALTLAARNIL